jgi:hypothetical protein
MIIIHCPSTSIALAIAERLGTSAPNGAPPIPVLRDGQAVIIPQMQYITPEEAWPLLTRLLPESIDYLSIDISCRGETSQ